MREVEGALLQTPTRVAGAVQASPVVANGIVYIASEGNRNTKEGLLVALDAETGEEVWQRTTKSPLFTTPIIVEDMIVVAMINDQAVLAAFDLENGDPEWSYMPILD
jgi:outer membrane protein assembly factor BamB